MNNARFEIEEEKPDVSVVLRERKVELTKIIEAINELAKFPAWQALVELVFDGQVNRIKKSLQQEAEKNELNDPSMYRLQGELKWALRYSDLYKLAETYKQELTNIAKKLNEKE